MTSPRTWSTSGLRRGLELADVIAFEDGGHRYRGVDGRLERHGMGQVMPHAAPKAGSFLPRLQVGGSYVRFMEMQLVRELRPLLPPPGG